MNHGCPEMFEATKKVFAQGEKLREMGLRVPQITTITETLRQRGMNVPDGVLTVDEAVDVLLPLLKKEGRTW